MRRLTSWFSSHHVDDRATQLGSLLAVAAVLFGLGGLGMAFVAGFGQVGARLDAARWWWLAPAFGGVVIAFTGYVFAYRGIKGTEGGPELDTPSLLAVVAAGFGGFLAQGGTALDKVAMRAGGAGKREAQVRISALAGFEHGLLAVLVCPVAIAAWIVGDVIPRSDFVTPWAIIPPLGFGGAIWAAERYRERLRERDGLKGKLGIFLDSIHLVAQNLRHPRRNGFAALGMALYWAGDIFALWATTAAFGVKMGFLAVVVCFGTGMLFTRRTAPLGGAGVMTVALVPTLWYGAGVPFAAATLGVVAYRLLTLWAPLPASIIALPKLRALVRQGEDSSGEGTRADAGEPALAH